MATQTICDRCKVVIAYGSPCRRVEVSSTANAKADLCGPCTNDLDRFMAIRVPSAETLPGEVVDSES